MRVSVRLFAALREQAGARERELDAARGSTVGDVWPLLGARRRADGAALRDQQEYVEPGSGTARTVTRSR